VSFDKFSVELKHCFDGGTSLGPPQGASSSLWALTDEVASVFSAIINARPGLPSCGVPLKFQCCLCMSKSEAREIDAGIP